MSELPKKLRLVATNEQSLCELEDIQLIECIADTQSHDALTELYTRYKSPITRFLRKKMMVANFIDEAYNDVMLSVWKQAHSFRGDSSVSTWIFGIAYRTQLKLSNKEIRHQQKVRNEDLQLLNTPDTASSQKRADLSDSVYAAMMELSKPHRMVIELSYFHGYNTREISELMNCPQNTVKTRLFHARQKLKTVIKNEHLT